MFARVKGKDKYRYLQLVENHRQGRRTVQRVLCSLGKAEELVANGSVDNLVRSLARFCHQVELKGKEEEKRAAMPVDRQVFKTLPFPKEEDTAGISRKSPILSDLAEGKLSEFCRLASERSLRRGQFLFFQGDPVDSWYIVATGMIKAVRHSPSGKDVVAAIYGAGDTLANILLFVDKPHICSGQAMMDTRVLEITRDSFISFLRQHPESGFKILMKMLNFGGRRFREATILLSELAAERTDYRLARTLLTLCLEFGNTIALTQREIAEMAGTTTETATRFLSQLRKAGVVAVSRGKMSILDRNRIRIMARIPVSR